MTRHRFDPLSFVFGLVFVVIAAGGLTGPWVLRPVDLAWAGPAVLILLGVVVLASGGTRRGARPPAHVPGGSASPQVGASPGGEAAPDEEPLPAPAGQATPEDEPEDEPDAGPARAEDG